MDVQSRLGCWQMSRFFLKHSIRDIERRKSHFCLGLCSVLIVVLSTLVVNTVIAKGPVIFMKLAQQDSGEIDCFYAPTTTQAVSQNEFWEDAWSLNYTQAVLTMRDNNVEAHLSPRMQLCGRDNMMMFKNSAGNYLTKNGTMCLKFIDTD